MALIYPNLAIVSVGMSCQTAHQIRQQKPFFDQLLGAEGVKHATPFDWLICPIPAALRLLDKASFYPKTRTELEKKHGRIWWPETGALYWHEPNDFDLVRSKFNRLEQTWRALARRPVLAIWSNSQSNLDTSTQAFGLDTVARQSDLAQLETALGNWFPSLAFCSVVAKARIDAADPPTADLAFTYDADDNPGDWRGNDGLWQDALRQTLARLPLTGSL
jgi:hypothetical protein